MKKRKSIIGKVFFIIPTLLASLVLQGHFVLAETYQYTIEATDYEVIINEDGTQYISMEGFGQILDPGKPKLPSKIFIIAIPTAAEVDTVEIIGNGKVELPDTYNIAPAKMVSAVSATKAEIEKIKVEYDKTINLAYASTDPYPAVEGQFVTQGAYRKYNFVQVRFSPFQYIAESSKLLYYPSATVTVNYNSSKSPVTAEGEEGLDPAPNTREDLLPEVEKQAAEILENYKEAKSWFPAPDKGVEGAAIGLYDFVIVTTDALVDAVQPLVDWEKSKGRTVYVATTTWIDANYSGADLQRRIRYFLRDKYPTAEWGITDVCLVGDLSDIPMRYTDPNKTGSSNTADLVPTDLYYAELTYNDSGSWDYDWDGFFGEYGDDQIDFIQEVNVARIPWSDSATVEAICQKIANYGHSTNLTSYKNKVLWNHAYFWGDTDGAVLSELLMNETEFDDMTAYRIYERSNYHWGYDDHRWSTYTADEYMTASADPFVGEWASTTSHYGFVSWLGHGSWASASYHCGDNLACWNFIHRDDCASLDDNYPAIVYSDSCSTAYPDTGSLGRYVMRDGGVSFVGASRVAYGAHGWNDPSDGNCESLHYEYARRIAGVYGTYTVGNAFKWALRTMYTTHGWGTSWYQMFEWTQFGSPDMRALAAQPSLPNIDYFYRTGWDYPIVPRSAAGATSTSATVTTTLPGNTSDTYFNWTWENNGTVDSPSAQTRIFIDENWFGYSAPSLAAGQSTLHTNWDFGPTVTGGRHTIHYQLDNLEDVWESSESDNCWGRQFVWSPYALADDTPVTRYAASDASAWDCAGGVLYYNNDGFSFDVQYDHPNKWWSAVGVLPQNSATDYDLRLWDIGNYTGSEQGFGADYIEWANSGPGVSDFVLVNDNLAVAGTYTTGAMNANNGIDNYHIEEATSTKIYEGSNGPYSMTSSAVLDIYEIYIPAAGDYGFKLEQTAGTCDLGMSLYDDETVHATKSDYMSGGYANSNGDGADEYFELNIPDLGYHGLVVWKADSSDYSKSSNYNIKMGECGTPSAPSGPSPADGATDVSVDADLDWADSTYTEYYEVWLKEGSNAWVKLGETESSAWTLPTLNEYTYYEWFIRAQNICGASTYTYFDFTTEDNTPPTPNPMTWATPPYENSTSQISMEATTATDPTSPINYYFDYTSSPTVGGGGTDSSWQAGTSYSDSGLGVNHQYGYRVYARDGMLNVTTSSAVSYDYTDIETPNGITFGSYGSTYIQARSTNTPSGLTRGSSGLYVVNSNTGANSGWKQDNNLWQSNGLTPNTNYAFRAMARNGDASTTAYCTSASRRTLANPPGAAAFSNITQSSIQANWTANSNPAGTAYYCENTTSGTNSGWTTATNWNSTALNGGTSYSFRVRSRNGSGIVTGWTSLGSQSTLPLSDLVVSSIVTDPVNPDPGESVDIEVIIANQGLGAAESSFATTFYKHLSTPPVVGQAGDRTWMLGSLASGASHTFTDTVIYSTGGSFNMYVLVDSLNDNTEDSEGNNILGPQAIKVGGSVNIVPIYLLLLSE